MINLWECESESDRSPHKSKEEAKRMNWIELKWIELTRPSLCDITPYASLLSTHCFVFYMVYCILKLSEWHPRKSPREDTLFSLRSWILSEAIVKLLNAQSRYYLCYFEKCELSWWATKCNRNQVQFDNTNLPNQQFVLFSWSDFFRT
jgi:hypothetical protein